MVPPSPVVRRPPSFTPDSLLLPLGGHWKDSYILLSLMCQPGLDAADWLPPLSLSLHPPQSQEGLCEARKEMPGGYSATRRQEKG